VTKRRTFIVQISSIAAGAVAGVFATPLKTQREVSLDQLGFKHFSRVVGSTFNVLCPGSITKLQLIEAKAVQENSSMPAASEQADVDEFSLLFEGAQEQPLEQNTYVFTHPRIGRFLMFIVPVEGADGSSRARLYRVNFNRPAALASLTV
jgi:hypothetical protein